MDVMTFVPTFQLPINPIDEHLRNFSRRAQRVCYENEQSNLLALTQLVLNSFLDDQIRGTRMLDATETREITDFFIMLEKCLWHGFKAPIAFIGRRKNQEAEIWHFIGLVSKSNPEMAELYKNVCEMNHLSRMLSKFRAFWRLAMMQKRLAEYFEFVYECTAKNDFYEPWALLRSEHCAFLCGAFLALGVFDCNLLIDNDQLQEQINSFDLSPYLRLPTLPGHIPEPSTAAETGEMNSCGQGCSTKASAATEEYTDLRTILDQKQYLEERNRQLCVNLELMRRKLEEKAANGNGSINNRSTGDDHSLIFTERLKDLERERDILRARLTEKEDNLRINQEHLESIRRFTEDLYEKLRASDSKVKRVQRDMRELREMQEKEVAQLNNSLHALQLPSESSKEMAEQNGTEEGQQQQQQVTADGRLRQEVADKTREYMEAMAQLRTKQAELSAEREHSEALKRRCVEADSKIEALTRLEKEYGELREEHKRCKQELEQARQALQEFSEALSESKLRIVELKEEILPLSEAKWIKDSEATECRLCDVQFSVLQRRHHCRNCGQIFCNECSSGRIKMPSNSNPVRVCLNCYHLLRNRKMSVASIVEQRSTTATDCPSTNCTSMSNSSGND